ncbi:MAG: hypothetical protein FWF08_03190 [Oscillospiraceae bacterium]|nr:hypothetical protein [Oscillospiraceae bacterium]
MKKLALYIIITLTAAGFICGSFYASAATLLLHTQDAYAGDDPAWLRKMSIYEEFNIGNLAFPTPLIPKPVYPYSQTPESFKEDVGLFEMIYYFNQDTGGNPTYIYALQQMGDASGAIDSSVSDDFIRSYLEKNGIIYPADNNSSSETLMYARALYTVMNNDEMNHVKIAPGTGVEDAFIQYAAANGSGFDLSVLGEWAPDGNLNSVNSLLTAFGKMALFNAGYDVSAETPDSEISRMMTVFMLESQGVAIDRDSASMDDLRVQYLALMLSARYNIPLDRAELKTAADSGNTAFYILRAIARYENLTVKSTDSFEKAFFVVAENTDTFELKQQLYSDIYDYDVILKYKREFVWVNATTLYSTDPAGSRTVEFIINGKPAGTGICKAELDTGLESQIIPVTVNATLDRVNYTHTYYFNIIQGENEKPVSDIDSSLTGIFDGSDIQDINLGGLSGYNLPDMGSYTASLPPKIAGVIAMAAPSYSNNNNQNPGAAPAAGNPNPASSANNGVYSSLTLDGTLQPDGDGIVNTALKPIYAVGGVGGLDSVINALLPANPDGETPGNPAAQNPGSPAGNYGDRTFAEDENPYYAYAEGAAAPPPGENDKNSGLLLPEGQNINLENDGNYLDGENTEGKSGNTTLIIAVSAISLTGAAAACILIKNKTRKDNKK